jgi:Cellulose biosynthesis protein BcsS
MIFTPQNLIRILTPAAALMCSAVVAFAGGLKDNGGPPEPTQSLVLFSGFDVAKDSTYLFQGAVLALNRDLAKDGFMLRAYVGHADYEYDSGNVRISGSDWQYDAMIGYKIGRGAMWAAAYIGIDYQDHKLTPKDPTNPVSGSEVGFKVALDAATLRTEGPLYASLSGNYSTAFDSYWARGRVGMNHGHMTFGPEVVALGNSGFDATRVGGFFTFDVKITPTLPLELTISAGHQFVSGDSNGGSLGGSSGGEGAYVGVSVTSIF